MKYNVIFRYLKTWNARYTSSYKHIFHLYPAFVFAIVISST